MTSNDPKASGSAAPTNPRWRRKHDRLDTGTLQIQAELWPEGLVRLDACGEAFQIDELPEEHLEWSAIKRQVRLICVLDGGLRMARDGETVTLEGGQWLCLPLPSRGVRLRVIRLPLHYLWLQGSGPTTLTLVEQMHQELGFIGRLTRDSGGVRAWRKLIREAQSDPLRDPFFWSDAFYRLLMTLWSAERSRRQHSGYAGLALRPRRAADGPATSTGARLLDRAPRTVQELADGLGYSRSHVTSVMTKTWQETPGATLRRDRIVRAAELLGQGLSVKEVARQVGYADHRSFGRAFRRQFGVAPSKYRPSRGENGG
ncbi:MAG: helix-turn-helix transcriptional regulator [Planctomycetota bacterium]